MEVLASVQAQLVAALGRPQASAAVTFVGAQPVEILRWAPDRDDVVRYATLGMSAHPMLDPAERFPDPARGPRAELVLSLRPRVAGAARDGTARDGIARDGTTRDDTAIETAAAIDTVARRLAVLAMTPFVEGVVIHPGAGLDLGEPLWDGAAFTAVLVGAGDAPLADLALDPPAAPVQFLRVFPMTPTEAAYKRIHGAEAMRRLWGEHEADLPDPRRRAVPLDGTAPRVRA